MAKFFCEYCGVYLSQSSPKGRKQHLTGKKHMINKIDYYTKLLLEAEREKTYQEALKFNKRKISKKHKLKNEIFTDII